MSTAVLRHRETNEEIKQGDNIIHRETRKVWRFEGIVIPIESSRHFGQFMIKVSMYSHKLRTRVATLFHPHLFLCEVQMVTEEVSHTVETFRKTWGLTKEQLFLPLWLGFAAWLVLAVADKTHLEDALFNWIH